MRGAGNVWDGQIFDKAHLARIFKQKGCCFRNSLFLILLYTCQSRWTLPLNHHVTITVFRWHIKISVFLSVSNHSSI